jgi:hypothetical protein
MNPHPMVANAVHELTMNAIWKCRGRLSFGIALSACLLSWLVIGETSPFADYFLRHVEVPNVWRAIHTIPYLIMVIFRPAIMAQVILYLSIFVQWLLIAFALSLLVCRPRIARLNA